MTHVAKIIELVGSSDKGWTEAGLKRTRLSKKDHQGYYGIGGK